MQSVGMLFWALWLATGLVRAVGWACRVFGTGGFWKRLRTRRVSGASAEGAQGEGAGEDGEPAS
jgi:hypothetical protein